MYHSGTDSEESSETTHWTSVKHVHVSCPAWAGQRITGNLVGGCGVGLTYGEFDRDVDFDLPNFWDMTFVLLDLIPFLLGRSQ